LAAVPAGRFAWISVPAARWYRLEVETADGSPVFEALVSGLTGTYAPPPLLTEGTGDAPLRWRVRAEDAAGREIARSLWRGLRIAQP
jgi:hypothetical protein